MSGGLGLAKNIVSSFSIVAGEGRVTGAGWWVYVGICGNGSLWKSSLIASISH